MATSPKFVDTPAPTGVIISGATAANPSLSGGTVGTNLFSLYEPPEGGGRVERILINICGTLGQSSANVVRVFLSGIGANDPKYLIASKLLPAVTSSASAVSSSATIEFITGFPVPFGKRLLVSAHTVDAGTNQLSVVAVAGNF